MYIPPWLYFRPTREIDLQRQATVAFNEPQHRSFSVSPLTTPSTCLQLSARILPVQWPNTINFPNLCVQLAIIFIQEACVLIRFLLHLQLKC